LTHGVARFTSWPGPARPGPAPAFAGAGFVRAIRGRKMLDQMARTGRAMTVKGESQSLSAHAAEIHGAVEGFANFNLDDEVTGDSVADLHEQAVKKGNVT
jgi:hypothetical protein